MHSVVLLLVKPQRSHEEYQEPIRKLNGSWHGPIDLLCYRLHVSYRTWNSVLLLYLAFSVMAFSWHHSFYMLALLELTGIAFRVFAGNPGVLKVDSLKYLIQLERLAPYHSQYQPGYTESSVTKFAISSFTLITACLFNLSCKCVGKVPQVAMLQM